MSSRSRQQLEDWLKTIEVKGHVLDIGGSQNPIDGKRCKTWGAYSYTILDLPTPHETKKHPDISFDIQGSVNELAAQYHHEQFDQVFCLEVSEYWHDPVTALRNINHFMKQNGELFISFHWLYGLHPPDNKDCLRYTAYGIQKIMERTGFLIKGMDVKDTTDTAKEHLLRFYREEGMRVTRVDRALFDEGYLVTAKKI
jgi:SAM-dependent methyltransferase